MWNVRTLNRGGKLENLKKEMQKNELSVLVSVKYDGKDKVKQEVVIIQCIILGVNGLKNYGNNGA